MNILELAVRIGYQVGSHRDIYGCPMCGANTRHTKSNDQRGAIGVTPDGMGWHCFQCEAGGDREKFVFAAHARDPSNVPADIEMVMKMPQQSATVYKLKQYPYPNVDIVNQFWGRCNEPNPKQVEYLEGRYKRSLKDVNLYPYCRELIVRGTDPYWLKGWANSEHDLIFSLYDAHGHRRSVIARKTSKGSPKSKAPPRMARAGLSLLSVRKTSHLGVIVEGEMDWLAWTLWAPQRPSVVGIFAGSWRIQLAQNFPHIHTWYVATDWDKKGNEYAEKIAKSFKEVGRTCQRITGSPTAQTELPLG